MKGEVWPRTRLGDICKKVGSGATPRGGAEVYLSSGIALIRSQNVYNEGFRQNGLAYISDEDAEVLANVAVQRDDVLLNITGDSVARCCLAPRGILLARVNQHVAIIRPRPDRLDARYLRYFLVSPAMQNHMLALAAAGATRNALTKGMVEDFEVPLPSIPEQRAIAHILGTLDDKIELNRRMNETLEAMTQAIFKSWFVNFDPVHAKAEGRNPGLPKHLADLFPDSFQDSELGRIPKGWSVGNLGDIVKVTSGKRPEGRSEVRDDTYQIPLFGGGGPMAYVKTPLYERPIILTGRVGTLGVVFRVTSPCWPSDNTLVVLPRQAEWYEFVFHKTRCLDFGSLNRGSTQPLVTQKDLQAQWVIIPSSNIVEQFHGLAKSICDKVDLNGKQFGTVVAIRDALLPKLLSGELRLGNPSTFLKDVP
ncbi:MAG: restriction endonuclease subunit S [Candidatus Eisenbacteria bacterium]|nr:restriction endonuclease subunit S [Candidatus Eisenbacteria bacterium]